MLPPRLLRDLLGEARVDAVHVLEAYGISTSQDGVAEGAQRVGWPSSGSAPSTTRCKGGRRILSRNLEFDSFSKSHSWAGYICFVLLREYSSISVTHGDSCNR